MSTKTVGLQTNHSVATPTGIDYLGLVAARHSDELAQRLRYSAFDTRLDEHSIDQDAEPAASRTEEPMEAAR